MKKKSLLLTLTTGLIWLTLSSHDTGPAAGGEGNHTGSAGSTASCDGSQCHSANSSTTIASVTITDPANSIPVVSYVPGKVYTVRISGTNTSANLPKFGFQLSSVKASNTFAQAGTLATGGTSGISVQTDGSLQLVEHTGPIAGTGSGNNWSYAVTCSWTAPAAGAGSVKFFLMLNAVNDDTHSSGDRPNSATVTLGEGGTNVATTFNSTDLKVYPNPAVNVINITQAGAAAGTWNINAYDMRGKQVTKMQAEVTDGLLNTSINSSRWAAGTYFIQLEKDGQQKVLPVIKQ